MATADSPGNRRTFFNFRFVWTEKRRANRLAFILFWSILMFYFFQAHVVSLGVVADISMYPTLPEGGYVVVNRYIYYFVAPERGEIVVFRRNGDASEEYVKRVIGLPGETLEIKDGQVYVDGRRLVEPYATGASDPDVPPHVIPKDAYFVVGDNRPMSEDSRAYGAVPLKDIRGKIRPEVLFPLR